MDELSLFDIPQISPNDAKSPKRVIERMWMTNLLCFRQLTGKSVRLRLPRVQKHRKHDGSLRGRYFGRPKNKT
jgi:hypothetical protein